MSSTSEIPCGFVKIADTDYLTFTGISNGENNVAERLHYVVITRIFDGGGSVHVSPLLNNGIIRNNSAQIADKKCVATLEFRVNGIFLGAHESMQNNISNFAELSVCLEDQITPLGQIAERSYYSDEDYQSTLHHNFNFFLKICERMDEIHLKETQTTQTERVIENSNQNTAPVRQRKKDDCAIL